MEELTDYEKERAARLAQNQAMLASLGLKKAAHEFEQVIVKEDELAKQRAEEAEERLRLASLALAGGVRRSTRLKGHVPEAASDRVIDGTLDEPLEQKPGRRKGKQPLGTSNTIRKDAQGGSLLEEGEEIDDVVGSDEESDGAGLSEEELEEEDYRPNFDDLSQEEGSEHEGAGDSGEDKTGGADGGFSKKPKRKRRRNGRAAQSATKASDSRKAGLSVEGGSPDLDDDELELQKALAMSMIDVETPSSIPHAPNEPSTSARNRTKHKAPPANIQDPQPDFFSSAQDVRDQINAHHAMQRGPLRAAQRTFFEQRTPNFASQRPSEAGPSGAVAGIATGNVPGTGPSGVDVTPEAKSGGGLRSSEQGGAAEPVGWKGSKGVKGRKQKALAQPPTGEEVDALFHIFNDRGGGQLSRADVRHVAEAHDFMWSDEELADMVGLFDPNRDDMLDQDDFRYLVRHCKVVLS